VQTPINTLNLRHLNIPIDMYTKQAWVNKRYHKWFGLQTQILVLCTETFINISCIFGTSIGLQLVDSLGKIHYFGNWATVLSHLWHWASTFSWIIAAAYDRKCLNCTMIYDICLIIMLLLWMSKVVQLPAVALWCRLCLLDMKCIMQYVPRQKTKTCAVGKKLFFLLLQGDSANFCC
jgi:hypothetical protein